MRSEKLIQIGKADLVPLKTTSASRVQKAADCLRKFVEEDILGTRLPENPAFKIGTQYHEEIEHLEKTGSFITDGKFQDLIEKALEFLPPMPLSNDYSIEYWFTMPTFEGGPLWRGKMDIIDLSKHIIEVIDHKTTKDLAYLKTPEELAVNIQLLSYAHSAFRDFPAHDQTQIRLTHVGARVEGKPLAQVSSVVVTREHVEKEWERILGVVRDMVELTRIAPKKSSEVTPNDASCGLYNGCPHRLLCGFETTTIFPRSAKNMGNKMQEMLDKWNAEQANVETVPAAAQSPPTFAEVTLGVVPPDAPSRTEPETETVEEPLKTRKKRRTKEEIAADLKRYKEMAAPGDEEWDDLLAVTTVTKKAGPIVLIGVLPLKHSFPSDPVPVETFLEPLKKMVADAAGVRDFGLMSRDAGKAHLAVAIRECMDKIPPVVIVHTFSLASDVFTEVVTPHASMVLKGTR